jgi:tRNA nucleotidyltransferase/poly(A) polymerase
MSETFKMAPHVKVQQRLIEKGFEAYLVGGCVRDRLLGRQPKDYDITTNALPEQVQAIFGSTVPVGAKFGVVVVVKDDTQVEVATYRADGAYTDGRRPDEVKYSTSAKDDVIRRDFTMNGLLLKEHYSVFDENGIVDYVGGKEDIKHRLIRAIGDPNVRFAEDALRMLRACRFAAQLNFKIEKDTLAAIETNARLLRVISAERVAAELFKVFTSPHPLKGLVPFFATGLGRYALPASYIDSFEVHLHDAAVQAVQRRQRPDAWHGDVPRGRASRGIGEDGELPEPVERPEGTACERTHDSPADLTGADARVRSSGADEAHVSPFWTRHRSGVVHSG